MVYLSVAKRLINFSPATLTDPVPVTAKKMCQTIVIFWEEDGHFFMCSRS